MASVYAWRGHLSGMEATGIEEGLLDETDNASLMIDKLSTVEKAEHDWKELVNDPSLSEVEISESNKTQDLKVGFGQKDWHHYLSAFSLNDEDTSNFIALETHTDHGQENFGVFDRTNGKEEHEKEDFIGNKSVTNVVEKVENVTLPVVSTIDGRKNIAESERGQNEEKLEQESSLKNSSHVLERDSFPTTSKQNLVASTNITDDENSYGRSKPVVRPGSAPATVDDELNTQPGLMSGTTDIVYGLEKSSKSTRRPRSVPLQTSVGGDWQPLIQVDESSNVNAHMQPSSAPAREEMQISVEERNILLADAKNVPNVIHNSSSNLSFTSSGVLSETGKKNDKSIERKTYQTQPKSALNIQDDNYFLEQSSSVLRTHLSGDGKDENKSENDNVSDESDGKEKQYSAGLRLNTNSTSFNTQYTLRPDHTETETSNVATSRETAENLPVRPLTIGDSLTIGTTLAYRPISPFEPDIYPTGTSVPDVPSTTSVATTYLSSSQYSEGTLNEEKEEDMSARERLQPLGRVGLEVKQGPPWGISMPLFQPHSRDSSLSSNDSNSSKTQFLQLQSTSSQQVKLETEPLQSMSSTPSETDLSRKTSIKSLEPKEPMGVKVMSSAGNLKTPIGKFRQQNPVDGDSPVSKILGPTFKATQKMLEELQRRPLEAYDERLEQLPVENTFEKETDLERERIATDRRPNSRSYGGLESGTRGEINFVEKEGSAQDTRRSHSREKINKTTPDSNQGILDLTSVTTTNLVGVNTTHSSMVDDRPKSRESRPSGDIIQEHSTNQPTPNLTPITTSHLGVVDNNRSSVVGGLQGVPVSGTYSKRKETNTPIGRFFSEGSITQSSYYDLTPISTANVLVDTTPSPVVPVLDGISERLAVNSHSRRNESRKTQQTSWMTDTTLGNSDGLSGYLVSTEIDKENEGREISKPENFKAENRNDASDLSEFDRVASESISWSNAVASQFREEMKSVDLEGHQRFVDRRHGETSVNERDAIISFLDSGLSESSTNDEIYRPKRLTRLSPGNGPIGIYDVRQSSGPGSTNRRRLALGEKPRESLKSLQTRDIYVSDGTTGTSGTDRDSRQSRRVHGAVYVSEGTTSEAEPVHNNGIDSEPEGQSTPKSENISTRQSKPMTDTYFGLTKSDFEKPTTVSHASFTTYEIEKPARLSPPVNYKPTRQNPPSFSTFEIDKFLRTNVTVTSSNGTLSVEHKTNALPADQQKGRNFMRVQPSATVEHTWSISKPVMSQLSTGAAPLGVYQQPRTQQQVLKQPTTHQHGHRRKRASQQKQIVSKNIQQHTKDQASDSMESEKNFDKNEKKSVADIILENMIAEEQEQKKRHKRLEEKQEQTTQDLNHLWERFQDVFGKKSRNSRRSKTGRRSVRETVDVSPPSSSDIPSSENTNITRQSVDTDSDEEFERFLRRIREIQSSESSHQEDNSSTSSKLSSSRVIHNQSESTHVERLHRKPRHPDSSTSMTSILSSDDSRAVRRTVTKVPSQELIPRKASRQNLDRPAVLSSSDTERKSESPVSLPMWLSVKNKEMVKQGKISSSCTCGAKSRKEKQKTSGVRDIGVNCPTPPIEEFLPVTTDIDVLKAGSFGENISHPASLIKLSLQDAFMYSKQDFIDKSRERVKKLKEKREERENNKMSSHVVVVPSEKIRPKKENKKLAEDRDIKPNKQFEQLQRKKPRPMTNKEIRDVNKRMYKNLPEVRKRKDEEHRAEFYKTNRLRAQLYGKHVRNTNRIFTVA